MERGVAMSAGVSGYLYEVAGPSQNGPNGLNGQAGPNNGAQVAEMQAQWIITFEFGRLCFTPRTTARQ